MADSNTAGVCPLVSRNVSGEAFSRALRLYVGRGRRYSCKEIERGCGVTARLIEAYLAGPTSEEWRNPSHENMATLFLFLGAQFASDWLAVSRLGAFELPDEEPDPGALAADNSDDNAAITRFAIDREFQDEERPELRVIGTRLMSRGATLAGLKSAAQRRAAA